VIGIDGHDNGVDIVIAQGTPERFDLLIGAADFTRQSGPWSLDRKIASKSTPGSHSDIVPVAAVRSAQGTKEQTLML